MFNLENPFRKKEPAKKDFFGVAEKPKTDAELAMEAALARAEEGVKKAKEAKKLSPELQKIKDTIDEKIESGEIRIKEIKIGGKDKVQLEKELIAGGNKIYDGLRGIYVGVRGILESDKFEPSKKSENIELIILSAGDLGFKNGVRLDEIYERAKAVGLEIAPAEVGPQLRIQYVDQPYGEQLAIGMESIVNSDGQPKVFSVVHEHRGLFLGDSYGEPSMQQNSSFLYVFVRRK